MSGTPKNPQLASLGFSYYHLAGCNLVTRTEWVRKLSFQCALFCTGAHWRERLTGVHMLLKTFRFLSFWGHQPRYRSIRLFNAFWKEQFGLKPRGVVRA